VTATWRDWLELTKPRIVAAGTVAALAGFLAANPHVDGVALAFSLAGIGTFSNFFGAFGGGNGRQY